MIARTITRGMKTGVDEGALKVFNIYPALMYLILCSCHEIMLFVKQFSDMNFYTTGSNIMNILSETSINDVLPKLQEEVRNLIKMTLGEREREIINLYYGLDNEYLIWEDISRRYELLYDGLIGSFKTEKLLYIHCYKWHF